jgi:hypothetical protein
MYPMQEALARERMREFHRHARATRQGELAAERRYHRVPLSARAAAVLHGRRAGRGGAR